MWTSAFQCLLILIAASLQHHEPVLLVGETGAGKMSVHVNTLRRFVAMISVAYVYNYNYE